MKRPVIIISILIPLATACYKPYEVKVATGEKVLVVDGLVTDQADTGVVVLSFARPFNSNESNIPVSGASVYVTDTLGNSFIFREAGEGDYRSAPLEFKGIPGRSYTLHIITPDGDEYESDPQKLLPGTSPDSIYAEFSTQEEPDELTGQRVTTLGAAVLADLGSSAGDRAGFRFASKLVRQYSYSLYPRLNFNTNLAFDFYCWQTIIPNPDINLTNEIYSVNPSPVKKHPVCFLDDDVYFNALMYGLDMNMADTTAIKISFGKQRFYIERRILYLNLYTLNNETYAYYKEMDDQMQSRDRLFDPVAARIKGNIRCISDPGKNALGFFEASSVSNSAYVVVFGDPDNSQPILIRTPYILPPEPTGCRINRFGSPHQGHNIPAFWIFGISQ